MDPVDLTVIVIDDDTTVLKAISRILHAAGWNAATFASPAEFLEVYDANQTGCLVVDLKMPEMSGLELQRVLCERGGVPPIIFLSGAGDIPDTVTAMKQGAVDFLTKPIDADVLLRAIQEAMDQERAFRQKRLDLLDLYRRLESLTAREREVFTHVISGQLNKQIAADLGTVEKTIKVHRARVMRKMHVRSLAELVQLADRLGIAPKYNGRVARA